MTWSKSTKMDIVPCLWLSFITLLSNYLTISLSKERGCDWKTLILYNWLSKSSHYSVWVFPINGESRNSRRVMFMWDLVPRDVIKELYNVMFVHHFHLLFFLVFYSICGCNGHHDTWVPSFFSHQQGPIMCYDKHVYEMVRVCCLS